LTSGSGLGLVVELVSVGEVSRARLHGLRLDLGIGVGAGVELGLGVELGSELVPSVEAGRAGSRAGVSMAKLVASALSWWPWRPSGQGLGLVDPLGRPGRGPGKA
jgi:hypothetical protein